MIIISETGWFVIGAVLLFVFASIRDCVEAYIESKQWKYGNKIKKLEEELNKIKESKEEK